MKRLLALLAFLTLAVTFGSNVYADSYSPPSGGGGGAPPPSGQGPYIAVGNGALTQADDPTRSGRSFDAVYDGGADWTGTIDTTTIVQLGINAATAANRKFVFSPGIYNITRLVLPSNAYIECLPGAVLYELQNDTIFMNTNAVRDFTNEYTPANRTNATDHDITILNCNSNFMNAGGVQGQYNLGRGFALFLLAQRVHVYNNSVYGDYSGVNVNAIPNMIRFDKVFDSDAVNNYGNGVFNGVGIWGGSENVNAHHNTYFISPNLTNSNAYSCSNINGMGSSVNDHQITRRITYENNTCYINGGDSGHGGVAAYNNGSLSAGSALNDFIFKNNRTIVLSGSKNLCFSANGAMAGWTIIDNHFEGCDTASAIALFAHAVSWGTVTNPFTTTNGSSLVTVAAPGVTTANVTVGNYLNIGGSTTAVGGLTLKGYYPVTAVSAGLITIDAGTLATSGATGGGSATLATYWGTIRNSIIARNRIINQTTANQGVIYVTGPGNIIKDNIIVGGSYGALTATTYFDCCSANPALPIKISGNQGQPGTGVPTTIGGLPWVNNPTYSYQVNFAPLIVDGPYVDQTSVVGTGNAKWFFNPSYFSNAATGVSHKFSRLQLGAESFASTDFVNISGRNQQTTPSWVANYTPGLLANAQLASTSTIGGPAIAGASRTSDYRLWAGSSTGGTGAVTAIGIDDDSVAHAINCVMCSYGFKDPVGNGITTNQFDIMNWNPTIVQTTPTTGVPGNANVDLILTPGAVPPSAGNTNYNVSGAINIGAGRSGLSQFERGITFLYNALNTANGGGGNGIAMNFYTGQSLRWTGASDVLLSELYGDTVGFHFANLPAVFETTANPTSVAGKGMAWGTAGGGLTLGGNGSSADINLVNNTNQNVLQILHGTQTVFATGAILAAGAVTVKNGSAPQAGGFLAYQMTNTSGLGIYVGSGAPTITAAQGSIYIRTDGNSTSTRLYVNTNGGTTWTNFTSAL